MDYVRLLAPSMIMFETHNGNQTAEPIAKHLTRQMCQALSYIHSMGITHRDLKPEVRITLISNTLFSLTHLVAECPSHTRRSSKRQNRRFWASKSGRQPDNAPRSYLFTLKYSL